MKITFLTGVAGSGKSEMAYKTLIEQSNANPEGRYFLIVPEQFTMQAQRNIVMAHPGHGTLNIDIVSFNRLAYRVFEELGISLLTTIDDTGKNLILRKVIDENKDKLKIIKVKDSQGFVSEIKSVISELLQYSVSLDMLEAVEKKLADMGVNGNERLRLKLMDIMTIYRGFKEYISEKFITTEEITGILCGCVEQSKILNDSVIVFDGFTGFTPVQYRLIELLFGKAKHMYFTATMPKHINIGEQLFSMSQDMLARIGRYADREGVRMERIQLGEREEQAVPYRFFDSAALAHLESNIFRDERVYEGETEDIVFYSAFRKKDEVQYVASMIRRLVEQEGYRYRDIGVIAGSLEDYKELVANTFMDNGIPIFMDNKRSILANPAVEYIRSAIQVIVKDYSYEAMFRFLKCHMCTILREDVDMMENYCLALGIRGHKRWNEKFFRNFSSKRVISLERINEIREQIALLLEPLYEAFHNQESTALDFVRALTEFVEEACVYERLEELKSLMEAEGKASLAREYGQSYSNIIKLFEQIASLLGDEKMKPKQFADVLDAGFNEIKVGIIPPTLDMVMVGDIERTRLDNVKAIFFVGVNEGVVPQTNANKGLLSELEREMLLEADMELAPTVRQKAYMQDFYLYLLFTKPSRKLFITYNREGKPSKIIANLKKMFPGAVSLLDEKIEPLTLINNENEGMLYLLEKLSAKEVFTNEDNALFSVLMENSQFAIRYKELSDRLVRQVSDEQISEAAARLLYGEVLSGSVSRMEKFAGCAFAHFAAYGLGLEERKIYEIGVADLGTLFHEALRLYSLRLSKEKLDFGSVEDDVRVIYVEDAVDRAMTDYNNSVFSDSSRNAYMKKRIKDMMQRTAWALGRQLKAGEFVPQEFEKDFVFEQDGMRIIGKIDRIDYAHAEDKSYVKIIDYKSGKKTLDYGKLYDGLQLQLMVYLESLSKENIPAAAMYYNIDNPIIDYEEALDNEEEAQDCILQALRPQGLVNGEAQPLSLLDNVTHEGKSAYIPVSYNKNGTLSKTSQAAMESQIRLLGEYSVKKMVELGHEIHSGVVAPHPYKEACTYCPYGMVCGFDKGGSYKKPTKLKADEEGYKAFTDALKGKGEE